MSNIILLRFSALCTVLLLGLSLSGCLTGGSVDAARGSSAKRIGVISLLGDTAHAQLSRLPAVLSRQYAAVVPDFQIDSTVNEAVSQGLRAINPGAQIVSLQSERNSLQPTRDRTAAFVSDLLIGGNTKGLEENSRRLAASHSLDFVVFVVPANRRDNSAIPQRPGYGYWALSLFGGHGDVRAYVNCAVGVFDGPTGRRLGLREVHKVEGVDGVPWRDSIDLYPSAERAAIGAATRQMISQEVSGKLRSIGLAR